VLPNVSVQLAAALAIHDFRRLQCSEPTVSFCAIRATARPQQPLPRYETVREIRRENLYAPSSGRALPVKTARSGLWVESTVKICAIMAIARHNNP